MAKKLLLDILVKVLGEYIELNSDNLNLNLAVWSGNIALKNLKVRRSEIHQITLISVRATYIIFLIDIHCYLLMSSACQLYPVKSSQGLP